MQSGHPSVARHGGTTPSPGADLETGKIRGRALVVDDEKAIRMAVRRLVAAQGFDVEEAANGEEAIAKVRASEFDVIVSDISMPRMSGLELLQAVRRHDLDVPVILVTGLPTLDSAIQAVEYGAFQYITKPFDHIELGRTVTRAANLKRMARLKREAMSLHEAAGARVRDLATLEVCFGQVLERLWLAYQPIVRASDGTVYGYEALMRSPVKELPHPGAVLDAAERLDGIMALGRVIRARATGPIVAEPARGVLFVNLHPQDLLDPDLTAPDSPLSQIASRVVLEITERASLGSVQDVRQRVGLLREMGFRIAVDDLGAGYAGLTSFATLQPDVVKIDMSLIRNVDSDPVKQKLVRSMTQLCKELGMVVVAEGIETLAEREVVTALGCDLLQGYLIARPGPPFPEIE